MHGFQIYTFVFGSMDFKQMDIRYLKVFKNYAKGDNLYRQETASSVAENFQKMEATV